MENDIALVKTNDMIPTNSKHIAPIRLWTAEIPNNTPCTISGFGWTIEVYIFVIIVYRILKILFY